MSETSQLCVRQSCGPREISVCQGFPGLVLPASQIVTVTQYHNYDLLVPVHCFDLTIELILLWVSKEYNKTSPCSFCNSTTTSSKVQYELRYSYLTPQPSKSLFGTIDHFYFHHKMLKCEW